MLRLNENAQPNHSRTILPVRLICCALRASSFIVTVPDTLSTVSVGVSDRIIVASSRLTIRCRNIISLVVLRRVGVVVRSARGRTSFEELSVGVRERRRTAADLVHDMSCLYQLSSTLRGSSSRLGLHLHCCDGLWTYGACPTWIRGGASSPRYLWYEFYSSHHGNGICDRGTSEQSSWDNRHLLVLQVANNSWCTGPRPWLWRSWHHLLTSLGYHSNRKAAYACSWLSDGSSRTLARCRLDPSLSPSEHKFLRGD